MPNNVKHFAVHADDVDRARTFYEKAFGWQFTAWGPPGFFLIRTGTDDEPGVQGALQGRREVVPGKPMFGFECTLGVAAIDETIAAVEACEEVIPWWQGVVRYGEVEPCQVPP